MSSELADKTGQASLRRRSASQFLVGFNRELVGVNVLAVAVEYLFQGKGSRHRCAWPAPARQALQSERAAHVTDRHVGARTELLSDDAVRNGAQKGKFMGPAKDGRPAPLCSRNTETVNSTAEKGAKDTLPMC
jgi:hypothetical protein